MRITFVMASGFDLSGGDRVIARHAAGLQQRGHSVFVVTRPRQTPTLWQSLGARLAGKRPERDARPSHFDGSSVRRAQLESFRPVQDRDVPDADVVVATWWETAEWVHRLSPAKGAKAFFVQHYEAFDYLPKERVDAAWRLPLQKIAVARWLVDLARERFGDAGAALVPNGVDLQQFDAPARGKQPVPTVGLLYSLTPWKGVAASLAALSLVARRLPELRVVSFGAEEVHPKLPLPARATHRRAPPQEELRELYAACDAWLCGSSVEGFALPPLEAMACRCPVVTTPVGAMPELVAQGKNGFLVPVGEAAAAAEQLAQVLLLPDQDWRAMSAAARQTAERCGWDQAVDRFEAVLTKLQR